MLAVSQALACRKHDDLLIRYSDNPRGAWRCVFVCQLHHEAHAATACSGHSRQPLFIGFAIALLLVPGTDLRVPLPGLLLNALLLPVNARRVWEIKKLTAEITRATHDAPVSQWLLPHMRRRAFKMGEVLFRKGDTAKELIYIAAGEVRVVVIGQSVSAGQLLGEIGLFSADRKRTQTLVAESAGELYEMTDEMLFQLYYQTPKLGFYMMRLITERLLSDIQRQQAQKAVA